MKKGILIACIVLLLVGLPWFWAFKSCISCSGFLGTEDGYNLQFVYVDKTHFDAYRTAVWFDDSLTITGQEGRILCNGKQIDFPDDKNTALVRNPEDIIFVKLDDEYFKEETGSSEIYFILGKIPKFKNSEKGMIDLEKVKKDRVIEKERNMFIRNGQAGATD